MNLGPIPKLASPAVCRTEFWDRPVGIGAAENGRWGRLGIRFPFFVGPMVGVTHVAFRELIRAYPPPGLSPLLFTEMLSTRRLPSQDPYRDEILFSSPGERAFIPQLLGNEERFIAPSIEKLMRQGPWGF